MKDQMINEAIVEAANQEEENVTFKPKILEYGGVAATNGTGDKCIDLYKRVKEGQYVKNTGVEDIEYER